MFTTDLWDWWLSWDDWSLDWEEEEDRATMSEVLDWCLD